MWCRVARAQADERLLVTMWPLYIIQSHLPLDINVSAPLSVTKAYECRQNLAQISFKLVIALTNRFQNREMCADLLHN